MEDYSLSFTGEQKFYSWLDADSYTINKDSYLFILNLVKYNLVKQFI